ncbi:MAG: VWA domain-containing protein [Dehalococcoidia bacterium]|nr:VWA domain-containing protein [Dehalococcoidia bacterium]
MMRKPPVRVAAALLLAGALLSQAPAHAQPPAAVAVVQVIAGDYPRVTAAVSVLDAFGTPIGGLDAASFSATEDGAPAVVEDVQAAVDADVGLAVVMVIDTSGSMAGAPLAAAREAALRLIDSLLPNDRASIIAFADGLGAPGPFTSDRQALAATLGGLQAGGATALYDAVIAGVRTARDAPLPRKVVVLLTDGHEWEATSAATMEQSLAEASAAGVPVFTIGVGTEVNVPYLEEVARRSGGRFIAAPAPGDIPGVYEGIGKMLRAAYILRLRLPGQTGGGESRLRVTVNAAGMTVSGETTFPRPGAAATPTSAPTPTPTPAPAAVAGEEGGGMGAVVWIVAVGLPLLLLSGGGALTLRIVRRRREAIPAGPTPAVESYRPPPVTRWGGPQAPKARLIVIDGPQLGTALELGDHAVTIGTDADCSLRLSDASGQVGRRHVRVWLREGRYMLHHLDRGRATRIGERRVEWAVLEPGDEIVIGPHRLRFEEAPS